MNETPDNEPLVQGAELDRLYERGAEPYWMQDVRLAQRRIDVQRISLRSCDQSELDTQ